MNGMLLITLVHCGILLRQALAYKGNYRTLCSAYVDELSIIIRSVCI